MTKDDDDSDDDDDDDDDNDLSCLPHTRIRWKISDESSSDGNNIVGHDLISW
jgi:hypothetical protein